MTGDPTLRRPWRELPGALPPHPRLTRSRRGHDRPCPNGHGTVPALLESCSHPDCAAPPAPAPASAAGGAA